MTKEKILEKLIPVVGASLNRLDREIVPTARFKDDLGADSLDFVQTAADIENAFNIRFTDEELEKIETVQDAVNLIFQTLPK